MYLYEALDSDPAINEYGLLTYMYFTYVDAQNATRYVLHTTYSTLDVK